MMTNDGANLGKLHLEAGNFICLNVPELKESELYLWLEVTEEETHRQNWFAEIALDTLESDESFIMLCKN